MGLEMNIENITKKITPSIRLKVSYCSDIRKVSFNKKEKEKEHDDHLIQHIGREIREYYCLTTALLHSFIHTTL